MTGLIYIVIIALWVAVLVPMWLRRHDQISEVRSTARFSRSMRTLAAMDVHPAGSARGNRAVREVGGMTTRTNAQQQAAKRRAVVLAALCGVLVLTLILGLVSLVPMWLPLLSALVVVAFMGASAMTAPARAAARPAPAERTERRVAAPAPTAQAANRLQSEEDWLAWNAWDDDESWEAVPATLPTYVSAPRATAVPRPIDKVGPGEWSGEAMVDAAQSMRRRVAQVSVDEVDHRAETAEIPVVRAQSAYAVNE